MFFRCCWWHSFCYGRSIVILVYQVMFLERQHIGSAERNARMESKCGVPCVVIIGTIDAKDEWGICAVRRVVSVYKKTQTLFG